MTTDVTASSELRDRFVTAGLEILQADGAAELTVRRVAEVAGSSTMGIYTCFGGRAGMLDAVYTRGFELLRTALTSELAENAPSHASTRRILALARAYRRFGLANPALYALMFERPLPDFDPPPSLRSRALEMTFTLLIDEVRAAADSGVVTAPDPTRTAYLLWTAIHGMVSIELTHALRSPLPGWFLDRPQVGEQILVQGVASLLAGLGVQAAGIQSRPPS
jgi:AcrR family transcriptional regulator